jgi:DNA-binding LacI/PurR family transcriptional regulator
MPRKRASNSIRSQSTSLKTLAEHLGLSASTVSFVLNDTPNRSIPENTRQRVREAAVRFGYQPSHIARALQGKRTKTIGVLLPELGDGYHTQVMNGATDVFMNEGYFFFTAHHRHRKHLVSEYQTLLHRRGAEALLTIDTHLEEAPPLPCVAVAGHSSLPGVVNVVLDHVCAAELALGHLYGLGHREIVFMRGQLFSSDSRSRWRSTLHVARSLGVRVRPELTIRLDQDTQSPILGYPGVQGLLTQKRKFTAVLCFNDLSAMGTIRSLHDAGLRVPQDVSVVGFDDIPAAAFMSPRLTTIRQPLNEMGGIAARLLLHRIAGGKVPYITRVNPELIDRESTGIARDLRRT